MSTCESLCIFHEELGSSDESATTAEIAAKILYFYPHTIPIEQQLSQLNLCEGILGFTNHFVKEESYYVVQTEKRFYSMLKCEPSLWIILCVVKSATTENLNESAIRSVMKDLYSIFVLFHGTFDQQLNESPAGGANGREILNQIRIKRKEIRKATAKIEANNEHNDDSVDLHHEVEELNTSLEKLLQKCPAERLRARAKSFIPRFLSLIDFSNVHLFNDLEGFHFFPVDKPTFLAVHLLLNTLQIGVGEDLVSSGLLFDGHLIWSDLLQSDMKYIYQALRLREVEGFISLKASNVTEQADDQPFWGTVPISPDYTPIWGSCNDAVASVNHFRRQKSFGGLDTVNLGASLGLDVSHILSCSTLPTKGFASLEHRHVLLSHDDFLEMIWAPIVYLEGRKRMLIYHACRITIIFVVKASADVRSICSSVEAHANDAELNALSRKLFHQFCRTIANARQPHNFIYFNHVNLALKLGGVSNQNTAGTKYKEENRFPVRSHVLSLALSENILDILDDIHTTFRRGESGISEICIKTASDGWVVGRTHGCRELFVIIDNKVPSLVGVQECVDEITEDYFGNIVL